MNKDKKKREKSTKDRIYELRSFCRMDTPGAITQSDPFDYHTRGRACLDRDPKEYRHKPLP